MPARAAQEGASEGRGERRAAGSPASPSGRARGSPTCGVGRGRGRRGRRVLHRELQVGREAARVVRQGLRGQLHVAAEHAQGGPGGRRVEAHVHQLRRTRAAARSPAARAAARTDRGDRVARPCSSPPPSSSPPPTATASARPAPQGGPTSPQEPREPSAVPAAPLSPPGAARAEKARRAVTHLVDIFLGRTFLMAVGFRVGVTEPHLRVAEENLKAHSHAPASAPRSPGARQAGGGHAPGAVSCAKALQERRKGTRHPGRAGRPEFGEGFLPKGGTRASFRVCHWARERDSADPRMQTRNGGHRRRARGPVEGVGRGRGGAGAPGSLTRRASSRLPLAWCRACLAA